MSDPIDKTRLPQRIRTLILIACVIALASSSPAISSASAAAEFTFDQREVATNSAKRQAVLAGFILHGAIADLAVVNIDESEVRRLRIYAFDNGAWAPSLDATLSPEVLFVDVGRIGGHDRLLTYQPGRLNWFDPESSTERPLVAADSNFTPPRREELPHVDLTQDVNEDGKDDLVVPDIGGFWVFIQMGDGAFADPVKIGPPTDLSGIYGADGYRYDPWSQSRVYKIDYNQDGRIDLAFWKEDHFEVHTQDERGLFNSAAKTFTTDVVFDSDDIHSLATGDLQGKVLRSLTDLNNDGVADLVVQALEGANISSKRTRFEAHFGTPNPDGGAVFASAVGIAFLSDGNIQLRMEQRDLNQDGQMELMFTTIKRDHLKSSLWKKIKGFMGDDIDLNLEFYRMEGGLFADKPNTIRKIALDGPPSHREPGWAPLEIVLRGATHESKKRRKMWPRAFNSALLIGDVTGDGLSDLIISSHPRQLEIYAGIPGPDLFAQRSQSVGLAIPNDEEYIWLADLNKDGKQNILMHHPHILRDVHGAPLQEQGTEIQRVTILLTRQ